MKIAIIGSGISGLTCAYMLNRKHDITIFEKNDYIGGHTHTHEIEHNGIKWNVDSGFIVYNERTYPNFINILDRLEKRTSIYWRPFKSYFFFVQTIANWKASINKVKIVCTGPPIIAEFYNIFWKSVTCGWSNIS